MSGLLSDKETVFNSFLLLEAVIVTGNTYTIDGHINKEFYTEDELSILKDEAQKAGRIFSDTLVRWENMKSFCFECIKGKKTPLSLKVNLCMPQENINKFLAGIDTTLKSSDIRSLNVNIKYDGSTLTCTTALTLSIFTLDKSVEHSFDEMFSRFLTAHGYDFE
ncbi:MAG: DUF5721 family protein [Lachnospiraceae bacterium]|nr:DUF5721 family protein [Lachnospiraceae bacterium]